MILTTKNILDEQITIYVDGGGAFAAEVNDDRIEAKTLEELEQRIERAIKKARDTRAVDVTVINIIPTGDNRTRGWSDGPFRQGRGVLHAKVRGKHERQAAWLLIEDGKEKRKFQISTYDREGITICRRLSAEEIATYEQLATAVDEAAARLEAFRQSVQIEDLEATLKVRK